MKRKKNKMNENEQTNKQQQFVMVCAFVVSPNRFVLLRQFHQMWANVIRYLINVCSNNDRIDIDSIRHDPRYSILDVSIQF